MTKFEFDGHTLEFGMGTSNIDPWTRDYARTLGIGMQTVHNARLYMRVDGDKVYLLYGGEMVDLCNSLTDKALENWDELLYFYKDLFSKKPRFSFLEEKKKLEDLKEHCYGTKETDSN